MTITSKIVALGALGAAAYGVARAMRRRDVIHDIDQRFDLSDLDDPVVVTEEVIVITEAGPYEVDLELIPAGSILKD
jgi:hypothetical protein